MFPVYASQPGMQGLHVPNVCTDEPSGNTIFCKDHCLLAEQCGYPIHVKEYLQYCGASQTAGKFRCKIVYTYIVLYTTEAVSHKDDVDVDSEEMTKVNETLKGLAAVESVAGVAKSQC